MKSKITGGETELIFRTKVLGKYDVAYYRCKETGFIQTEEPYWLEEAYSSAITSLDLGLLKRNVDYSERVEGILLSNFNVDSQFLDYAGGYGTFTRLMRDKGFNFFHTDKFCDNLFANHFELEDSGNDGKFELVTAFELFEHLKNPEDEVKKMFEYSDSILFSTELVPEMTINSSSDWWYFSPETGQHISFYTVKSLQKLAAFFNCNLHTDGSALHLFTKKNFDTNLLLPVRENFLPRKLRKFLTKLVKRNKRKSLLEADWKYVKNIHI